MKKQYLSYVWMVTVATLVGGFLAVYWLLVLPQVRTVVGIQRALEADSASGSKNVAGDSLTKSEEEVLIKKVDALLPVSDLQYDLAIQVEALAKSMNAGLSSLALSSELAGAKSAASKVGAGNVQLQSGVKRVTLTVSVEGDFATLEQFVTGLPRLERFLTIDQVSVTQASSTTGEATAGRLSAQVTAFAYYLPEVVAEAAPVTSTTPKAGTTESD